MADYNDGKWHGWNGGECPVAPDSLVQTIWLHKDGAVRDDARDGRARGFPWVGNEYGDIVAFRVTKPAPPKPRTIYLCEVHGARFVFDTAIAATREALEYQHGEATVTEFVEVTK